MQERHDRPAEHTVEVPLGPLLSQTADAIEAHVEARAEHVIARAMKMRAHPGNEPLAYLVDQLLTTCTTLATGVTEIPEQRRTVRGLTALETWQRLAADGPADGPLGGWSYAHHLAQAARDMLREIQGHRARREAAFVGRPGLPPLAPDAP